MHKEHSQRETALELNPEGHTGVSPADKGILGRLHSMGEGRWKALLLCLATFKRLPEGAEVKRVTRDGEGERGQVRKGPEHLAGEFDLF